MPYLLNKPRTLALVVTTLLTLPLVGALSAPARAGNLVAPKDITAGSELTMIASPTMDPSLLKEGYGMLVGRVTDTTGTGVPGTSIMVEGTGSTVIPEGGLPTLVDGSFWGILPVGTYSLTLLVGPHYKTDGPIAQAVTVTSRTRVAQDFPNAVTRVGGVLTGTVTDTNNKPVAGVTVHFAESGSKSAYSPSTNEQGQFYYNSPVGALDVSIISFPEGYGLGNASMLSVTTVQMSSTVATTLNYPGVTVPAETGSVWGKIIDTTGKPVVGAGITFTPTAEAVQVTAVTDATGNYQIVWKPGPGRVSITSTPVGWVRTSTYSSIAATVYLGKKYERSFPKAFAPSAATGATPVKTAVPTLSPAPAPAPTPSATSTPSAPTTGPVPTKAPTVAPTATPSLAPTAAPTVSPTKTPTAAPKPTPTSTVSTRAVQGTVTDQFGNVVAGVRLTLTTTTASGKVTSTATTNAAGAYSAKVAMGNMTVAVTSAPKGYTVSKFFGVAQSPSLVGATYFASFYKGVIRAAE